MMQTKQDIHKFCGQLHMLSTEKALKNKVIHRVIHIIHRYLWVENEIPLYAHGAYVSNILEKIHKPYQKKELFCKRKTAK